MEATAVPLAFLCLLWAFAVAVVLAYLPYVYFQSWEWTYTRFLLPGLPIMWLLTYGPGARVDAARATRPGRLCGRRPRWSCVLAFSLSVANARYAFELRDGEQKYLLAADYVREHLPANAVIFSMQHSGSLWFYTRRPIVRWDNVDPRRLDAALGWLSGQWLCTGHHRRPRGDRPDQRTLRAVGHARVRPRQARRRSMGTPRFIRSSERRSPRPGSIVERPGARGA